jgi:transglutaminase-like putative cysteine protease
MLKQPIRLITLIFAYFMACFSAAKAAQPQIHIAPSPAWLNTFQLLNTKVPARDIADGYFYQLFEVQMNVEKQATYSHIVKEIVSEAGIQNASSIYLSFDPSFERLDIHSVTVWRNNKPLNKLSTNAFKIVADEKELSRFIYQGSYSAYCILDDIRKGDRIEYSYTITGRNPIFKNKFAADLYFQSSVPFAQVYRSIQIPSSRKLNFKSFNNAPKVAATEKNGQTIYVWDAGLQKAVEYFDSQPGWYNNYAHTQVSEYNGWQDVVNWGLGINPAVPIVSGSLAKQVAQLKAASKGDQLKYFREAVKLVQDEVRYMGVELGEYSHRANNPERVFNQRYGDCKDKALLLVSILNANGIEAHMVLINSSAREGIADYLPSPGAFDHAVAVANVNGKQIWVDATISYQRGTGVDIYFPNYGRGLVLKPGNNALTTIRPSDAAGKMRVEDQYIITNEKSKVNLQVTSVYTLGEADKMRDQLASTSRSETEKNYLNYYAKIYPKIEQADSVTIIDDTVENKLTTIEHYKIPNFFKTKKDDGKFKSELYANYINDKLPFIPNKTSAPVALQYPFVIDYTVKVTMSHSWNVDEDRYEAKNDAYSFARRISIDADTLVLNYHLANLKSFIPVNKIDEIRDDVKKISDEQLGFTPDIANAPLKVNAWMIFLVIIVAVVSGALFSKLYRTETHNDYYENGHTGQALGGWLILIGIGLAVSPFTILYTIFDNNYFAMSTWGVKVKGWSVGTYNAAITFEAVGNTILLCYTIFCGVLFIKRRDILPKHIIIYYTFNIVFLLVDNIILSTAEISTGGGYTSFFRRLVFSVIWTAYFMKSERVKQTFVVPYIAPWKRYSLNNYKHQSQENTDTEPEQQAAAKEEEETN